MGRLTTHVLDTARGCPGGGIAVDLLRCEEGGRVLLRRIITNADGRADAPLLEGDAFTSGIYELVFHVGEYFAVQRRADVTPPFLDEIVLRFGVATPSEHYHVPLLIAPFGYATYRGS